jgi:hypothetical protein
MAVAESFLDPRVKNKMSLLYLNSYNLESGRQVGFIFFFSIDGFLGPKEQSILFDQFLVDLINQKPWLTKFVD